MRVIFEYDLNGVRAHLQVDRNRFLGFLNLISVG